MAVKGMMFKGFLVPKVLDGSKPISRRIEKSLSIINQEPDKWRLAFSWTIKGTNIQEFFFKYGNGKWNSCKPRYQPEDEIYIKEAWLTHYAYDNMKPSELPNNALVFHLADADYRVTKRQFGAGKTRSSLFLPQRFARPWRGEIISVRAERLWDITPEEVKLEGFNLLTEFQDYFYQIHKVAHNIWVFRYEWKPLEVK